MTDEIKARMRAKFDEYIEYLPDHIRGGMERYVFDRIPPGSFLRAVLENDLKEAIGRADDINIKRIHDIVLFVVNGLPQSCQGSVDRVRGWLGEDL